MDRREDQRQQEQQGEDEEEEEDDGDGEAGHQAGARLLQVLLSPPVLQERSQGTLRLISPGWGDRLQ